MKYSLRNSADRGDAVAANSGGHFFSPWLRARVSGHFVAAGVGVLGFLGALVVIPLVLCSWALVKLGHRDDRSRDYLFLGQVSLDLAIFALFVIVGIPAIVTAIVTMLWGRPF